MPTAFVVFQERQLLAAKVRAFVILSPLRSAMVLGHAGEGTFMTQDEQAQVIHAFVESTNGRIPVIAGITLEGTKVAEIWT